MKGTKEMKNQIWKEVSWKELVEIFREHEKENPTTHLTGRVVYTRSS